ncbi:hypothetical protein BDV23DRAFT_177189 [Aspergillus alliaceus]|uniref:Zn(2)-C6 fungal-type domain-containing protein n=1 Tax=Petromyces alliaceus TaxID=209559 RepID=A0A5N7BR05_PETAA|nr:hypothetical protein BDV23DRAFT_177189 [Aspergillus alliaceus]
MTRRTHHKSRSGCRNCKSRRVKCDETRPECTRCQVYGVTCDYNLAQYKDARQQSVAAASRNGPLHRNGSLAFDAMTANIDAVLQVGLSDEHRHLPGSSGGDNLGVLGLDILTHFSRMVAVYTPRFAHLKQVFRERTFYIALSEPCLLYAMLAAASTHRTSVLPSDPSQSMVAAQLRHDAARMYRQELQSPIGRHNMDVLMSTCILIGMFSFFKERIDPSESWVLSDDSSAMNWLSVQGGLRCLIELVNPWLNESIWSDAFKVASTYEFYDDHRMGREDLDPDLADLCDINDETTEETNTYHWPLRMLCPLLRMPRHQPEDSRITNFMGRLEPGFLVLLGAKDPPLMCSSVHEWWVDARVRSECQAICMYLEWHGDQRIVDLLEFPATVCGYRSKMD